MRNFLKNFVFSAAPKLNVPPRFRDTAYFDKGENVIVKIPFTGHPKPKITWVREGEHIEAGGHYHVERKGKFFRGPSYSTEINVDYINCDH